MKVILFIIALLNFTFIITDYSYKDATDNKRNLTVQVNCDDSTVSFPGNNNETSYDYCRSLYFDKEKYYRCCYAKTSNKTYGCVLTNYSAFASEDSIKEYINGFDDAEIDCEAKYIGVSLLVLFLALF